MKKIRKFLVIKEYPRYYLAKDILTKTLECFFKNEYTPDEDNTIEKKIENYQAEDNKMED